MLLKREPEVLIDVNVELLKKLVANLLPNVSEYELEFVGTLRRGVFTPSRKRVFEYEYEGLRDDGFLFVTKEAPITYYFLTSTGEIYTRKLEDMSVGRSWVPLHKALVEVKVRR